MTKTIIVTGANTGIGKETARELAKQGCRVILACRSLERGQAAADEIIASTSNTNVIVKKLDLSSFKSVRAFVADIEKCEPKLDVLINNAAMIGAMTRTLIEEGLEIQFATNHLGPFLLTNLLIPLLKKSAPSRIVMVSSVTHHVGTIDFDNLNAESYYNPSAIYYNTKLANILFAVELSKRLEGSGVTINSLHPGVMYTDLYRNLSGWRKLGITIIKPFIWFFLPSIPKCAETSVYLALSDKVEGVNGKYFDNCAEKDTSSKAKDLQVAEKLWEVCAKYTGLTS